MDETPITIRDYDPTWPETFEAEQDRLETFLDAYTSRIEHIGSTAVEGLGAKPVIDVLAVVTGLPGVWGDLDNLATFYGYELSHVPMDWLFVQRTDDSGQLYNLHLIPESDDQWRDDLLFREYLRANPDARDEYEAVKRDAAESHPDDISAYNAAKADFCRSVLSRAEADESVTVPDE
ncbi:GrpB family protein [Halorussus gelatinilyticus]|uniref:GrpB family protein n=1 Tax=Halorussus gelatinilyticus TaxID=2937524 RepID=A0A8U0IP44_9EURY|nr:GrpB family protein [Halorussus gelatinilyticus]UPW01779.1 GrpB family protein [Halorussus gelatinilyticus]